jgi:DtxR family transcriptional regulator, Mn-dependent transcriptional regulator
MRFSMKPAGTAGDLPGTQKLTPAMEDYLKNIFILEQDNRVARVSDISRRMNVRKASVVSAVSFLQKNEMLKHEKYGFITLTDAGRHAAAVLKHRYEALYAFFGNDLKMEAEQAASEACSAEHVLSTETVAKIKSLARIVRKIPVVKAVINKNKKKK